MAAMRRQSWWWLLLAAFVVAVLNLVLNGWQFIFPGALLFFTSNVLSMALAVAALAWSLLDLMASYSAGLPVRAAIYVTSWVLAVVIIVGVDLWTLSVVRLR